MYFHYKLKKNLNKNKIRFCLLKLKIYVFNYLISTSKKTQKLDKNINYIQI